MQFDGELIENNSGRFGARRLLPRCLDVIIDDFFPLAAEHISAAGRTKEAKDDPVPAHGVVFRQWRIRRPSRIQRGLHAGVGARCAHADR